MNLLSRISQHLIKNWPELCLSLAGLVAAIWALTISQNQLNQQQRSEKSAHALDVVEFLTKDEFLKSSTRLITVHTHQLKEKLPFDKVDPYALKILYGSDLHHLNYNQFIHDMNYILGVYNYVGEVYTSGIADTLIIRSHFQPYLKSIKAPIDSLAPIANINTARFANFFKLIVNDDEN